MRDVNRFLLPFHDIPSLKFAVEMRQLLGELRPEAKFSMAAYLPETGLTPDRVRRYLPEGPDQLLDEAGLRQACLSPTLRAIIANRMYKPMIWALERELYKSFHPRPCIMSFLTRPSLFPEKALQQRGNCDVVYLFPRHTQKRFQGSYGVETKNGDFTQKVDFGHPFFYRPEKLLSSVPETGDLVFLAQQQSPSSLRGRKHLLEAMVALAKGNPERQVLILENSLIETLPGTGSGRQEGARIDGTPYKVLCEAMGNDRPSNLHCSRKSLDSVVNNTAVAITCTQAEALFFVSKGVPTMVYLDFIGSFEDPLVTPMRELFSESGLILSLDSILELKSAPPDRGWVNSVFCGRDLGRKIIADIDNFHA